MSYQWPLNVSNFTWLDRLKICSFFLNPNNFWTQNGKVKEFETEMAKFMKFKWSVFVSSGSAANTILAMYLKDKLVKSGEFKRRNIVVLPSTTWQTSCSPWIREGFKPHFIDVSLSSYGLNLDALETFLTSNHKKVACVFPTALLGFNIDYVQLSRIRESYPDITFYIDQCENNFGKFDMRSPEINTFTSTTSTYMGHELQSVEGGFIFTNKQKEYEQFLMYRNHGMVRSLAGTTVEPAKGIYENKKVDSRFDFYCLGNNFRNTDINAFIGLLDLKRANYYVTKRNGLYGVFQRHLNRNRYILPTDASVMSFSWYTPFCLPIICKGDDYQDRLNSIKLYCLRNKIETRPIISGFLGYQTAYQGMMDEKDYPNSVLLHKQGIYVGLNTKLKKKQIFKLVNFLNRI